MNTTAGIEALNVYCGACYVDVMSIFEGRRLNTKRFQNLMMSKRSIALPCEDPVTHAVNAAKPIVDGLSDRERQNIGMLITGTESGLDYSKSIASYVHEHLGLSRNCRLLEVKQACFAMTGVLQLALAYLSSGAAPDTKVLVIGTDVALVDSKAEYTEPTIATGAAAMLLSTTPDVMAIDRGAFGSYSFETLDSARPSPELEIADVDESLFTYLDCLSQSYSGYAQKVEEASFTDTFDYLAFHTPFCGLVKSAHKKMMKEHGAALPEDIERDFIERVGDSLRYPGVVGNLCSGSVYLALASIIDNAAFDSPCRVGMFSYGSGCASEFFSGVVDSRSREVLGGMRIGEKLGRRVQLSFDQYERFLQSNRRCLLPCANRQIDNGESVEVLEQFGSGGSQLVLEGTKNYHRKYAWA